MLEEWLKYPSVERMVWRITGPRRQGSKRTAYDYAYGLRQFVKFCGYDDPEIFLEDIKAGKVDVLKETDRWIDAKLKKGNAPKTLNPNLSGVKKWLQVNDVEMNWKKIEMPKMQTVEEDRAPTREELAKIIGNLNLRNKVIAFIGLSSGLRLGTILSLKWSEIDLESYEDLGKISVGKAEGRKITNGNGYVTFISKEAEEALIAYRDYKGSRGEYVFSSRQEDTLDESTFQRSWNLALRKSGLEERTRRIRMLHFHVLRKYFRTQCEVAGVRRGFFESWMGHGGYLDKSYFRGSEQEHLNEFRKCLPYLEIMNSQLIVHKSLQELEQRQRIERETLSSEIEKLRTVVEQRKGSDEIMNKLFSDPKFLEMLKERMKELKV